MSSGPLAIHLHLFHKWNYCPRFYRWGKWESEKLGPQAQGYSGVWLLTEFHLKLQVCQVCWLKSLTLRFTALLLSLSTEAMWRAVFVHLSPSGWPESGHTDANAHRKVHRTEGRQYLPTQIETWTFGTDIKGCRWSSSSNHQSSYNREGKVLRGCLDHPRDSPWAAVTPFSAQHQNLPLDKTHLGKNIAAEVSVFLKWTEEIMLIQ